MIFKVAVLIKSGRHRARFLLPFRCLVIFIFAVPVTFSSLRRYIVVMGTVKLLLLVVVINFISVFYGKEKDNAVPGEKKKVSVPVKQDKQALWDWKTLSECLKEGGFVF